MAKAEMRSSSKIPIFLRLRPTNGDSSFGRDKPAESEIKIDFDKNEIEVPKQDSNFKFSKIFPCSIKNNELFKYIGTNLIGNVLEGNDSTIFTVGPSCSGKTYSILGNVRNPGILVESIKYILESIKKEGKECVYEDILLAKQYFGPLLIIPKKDRNKNSNNDEQDAKSANNVNYGKKYFISLNIFELYNDQIFDLLSPSSKNRRSKEISKDILEKKHKPRDLTSRYVNDLDEAHYVTLKAVQKRHIGNTIYNEVSSRGHIFIYINLHELSVMGDKNKLEINTARLTICDLAGTERSLKLNDVHKQECNKNNIHLLQLGRVLVQLADPSVGMTNRRAIIRSSKMTRLLFADYIGNRNHLMFILASFDPSNPNLRLMNSVLQMIKSAGNVSNTETKRKSGDLGDCKKKKENNILKKHELAKTIEILKNELAKKEEEIAIIEYTSRYETALEYQETIKRIEEANIIIQKRIDKEGMDSTDQKLEMLQKDMNSEMANLKQDITKAHDDMIKEYETLLKQKNQENKKLLEETKILKRKFKELASNKIIEESSIDNDSILEKKQYKKKRVSLETSIHIIPNMFKPVRRT